MAMIPSRARTESRRVAVRCRARMVALLAAVALVPVALANPAAAQSTDPGPPITEIVPVRIHGHDSSWPPVLIFAVLVVVGGGVVVAVVFLRRARAALRTGRPAQRG
jgi:hypothetical protein